MKINVTLALISAILVSGCLSHSDITVDQGKPETVLSTHISEQLYRCDSGNIITVTYPTTESATIDYKGEVIAMQIGVSGSGSRYIGGGLEWWSKNLGTRTEGVLLLNMPDGNSGDIVEHCVEN